jgi:hypothetical protein
MVKTLGGETLVAPPKSVVQPKKPKAAEPSAPKP